MDMMKLKAALKEIEISVLELSVGNYEEDEFESDCQHIADTARKLWEEIAVRYDD